jgi:internalin A
LTDIWNIESSAGRQTMLKPLVRNKIISAWEDTKISSGYEWRGEIKQALVRAKAAVLLVSPYFLESDFIAQHELPPLLDAARARILWVYISHCLYDETEIEHYQAANEISKPLDSLTSPEQNRVLVDVCRKI